MENAYIGGLTWNSLIEQTGLDYGSNTSVSIQGNLVIAVGANNAKAVAVIGEKR
jgi:hypothetical protein